MWDSISGEAKNTLRGNGGSLVSVAFSPLGTHVAAGAGNGTVAVWDLEAQEVVTRLANQGTAVSCLRWSPGGDRVAIALGSFLSPDSARLVVWSPERGTIEFEVRLMAPLGALDWLSGDAVLLADWAGIGTVHHLDGSRPDELIQLDRDELVAKNKVSEAHWSPNCRLISDWAAGELLSGAE
jgi:WD40 repeat protein